MAKKIVLALLFPIFLWISCTKNTMDDPFPGNSTALFNGTPVNFKATATLFDNERFSISILEFDVDILRLHISITKVPNMPGAYELTSASMPPRPTCLLFTVVEDISKDDYILMDDASNELKITGIDTKRNELSGTYQLTFIRDTLLGPKEDLFPDTIYLEQGSFTTKYDKRS